MAEFPAAGEVWTSQLRVAGARAVEEAPEIAFIERTDVRGRPVRAYILAESLGPGGDPFIDAMVTRTAEEFDPSSRSLTGALARVIGARHAELREWNRTHLPADQAAYGVSCLLARAGEPPILAQAGPSLALIAGEPAPGGQRPLSVRAHFEADPVAAPVGSAAPLRVQFVQGSQPGGWVLLLSAGAAALLDPSARAELGRLGGEEVLGRLYPRMLELGDAAALIVDFRPPPAADVAAGNPFEGGEGAAAR